MAINTSEQIFFSETQKVRQKWLWLLAAVGVAGAWFVFIQGIISGWSSGRRIPSDVGVWVVLVLVGIGLPWFIISVRLITQVRIDHLYIRLYPFKSRLISFKRIARHSVREYRPIRDYGGWGIRWSWKNGMAYTMSGNRGVQLELSNGKKVLVGSQKPEELEAVLFRMMGK